MKSSYDIIKHIMMTEKCTLLKGANQYSFKVCSCATKTEIAAAIEDIYEGVKVKSVNIMNIQGKNKRQSMAQRYGKTSKTKKAIVTLTEDSKDIEIFEGL